MKKNKIFYFGISIFVLYFCKHNSIMDKSIHSDDYKVIINLLRKERETLGMTQQELAQRMHVKQAMISKIETCERRLDVIELRSYCNALGISFVSFMTALDKVLEHD